MHDLFAAKDILDIVIKTAQEKKLKKITRLVVELGNKEYEHGGHKHFEEVSPENLEFNLKLITKNTIAENAEVVIERTADPDIRLKEIEGE